MKTTFVGIAAYNEYDLEQTIYNCLDNSVNPDSLRFGVWSHYNNGNLPKLKIKNVRYINTDYPTLLGVGHARLNTLALYDGEDYYLQIDSHMLFDKDWDSYLIDSFEELKKTNESPLITTYTPWWSKNEDGSINYYSPENNRNCSKMVYDDILDSNFPRQKTIPVEWKDNNSIEHYGFSAHFAFSDAKVIYEVMPDPYLMFYGEEPTTAVRLWTRGYKIFAIKKAVAWHKNKGHGFIDESDSRVHNGKKELYDHYLRKTKYSLSRTRDILTGKNIGYWGASSLEQLHNYEVSAKIDFKEFYSRLDRSHNV